MLNTIHHEGLRPILRAFKPSSVESLYRESHEPPLQLRHEKLALQYYIKLKSFPTKTTYKSTFHSKLRNVFDQKEKEIKPRTQRIRNLSHKHT